MSLSLFAAIVVLIVIFAIVMIGGLALYTHYFTKRALQMQLAMLSDLDEGDEADFDTHYEQNRDLFDPLKDPFKY